MTSDYSIDSMESQTSLVAIAQLLDRFAHFGVELGLERIQRLLAALGNPQHQVPILHVAGSNGKGSVCAYLSAVLTNAGYRVGRYTSPHLVSWCERICVNQQAIAPSVLHQLLQRVIAAIDPAQSSPTQFEVITAAAWLYFAEQQVDIAVIEVGLGGRLDATNVCDRPLVSLITSLSREHWQRLGPTLADISREKAGILKPHCPAVIAPQVPEAEAVLKHRLAELDCPTIWVEPAIALPNDRAEYHGNPSIQYHLPLPGEHQFINSAVAIAALQILQQQGWQLTTEQIIQGIAKTEWQGRLQWFDYQVSDYNLKPVQILIDGAHNPAGAKMLRQYVDKSDRFDGAITWVMGMISTKDYAEVFQELLHPGDRLYLVPVPEHQPTDLQQLAAIARQVCPDLSQLETYEEVIVALNEAIAVSSTPVILCGSLYLIGHFAVTTRGKRGRQRLKSTERGGTAAPLYWVIYTSMKGFEPPTLRTGI
jgi:dihydrofolate synthase / folylpolyglutamate synthase